MCCDHCQEHAPEVFEEKEGLSKLVDLANMLDEKGLPAEANLVDSLIVEAKKKKDEKKKKKEEKDDKKKGKKPFWLQKKKAELIQLADTLDSKGLQVEANVVDKIIKSLVTRRPHFANMSVPIPGFEGFTLKYTSDPSIIGQKMREKNFQHFQHEYWYEDLVNSPSMHLMYKGFPVSVEAIIIGMRSSDIDIENLIKEGKDNEAYKLLLDRVADHLAKNEMKYIVPSLIRDGIVGSEGDQITPELQSELKVTYGLEEQSPQALKE